MIIERIKIKNYRSFGEEGVDLRLKPGMNVIVGENNVGKSNLLKAIKLLQDLLSKKMEKLEKEEWHNGKTEREIILSLYCTFNEDEHQQLMQLLIPDYSGMEDERDRYKYKTARLQGLFDKKIEITFTFKEGDRLTSSVIFKWGILYITIEDRAFIELHQAKKGLAKGTSNWNQFFNKYFDPQFNFEPIDYTKSRFREEPGLALLLTVGEPKIYPSLSSILKENVKLFHDVRQKPQGEHKGFFEAFDGAAVDDVLSNLKNGNPEQRAKYALIAGKFSDLLPDLELEVVREPNTQAPDIHVVNKNTNYEVSLNSAGTGIIEIVIFLANIIAARHMTICVEDPELHLHPHAQRLMENVFQESAKDNQLLVITHSPSFIGGEDLAGVIMVEQKVGQTRVKQLPDSYFNKQELAKLKKTLSVENKELFFSRKVLLLEGETEKGFFPTVAKTFDLDFDVNGITAITVGGKDGFLIFLRLLKGYDIPYFIICDEDAVLQITCNIDDIETSSLFCQLKKAGILEQNHYNDIIMNFRHSISIDKDGKKFYDTKLLKPLKEVALHYKCLVLSPDFERFLKRIGPRGLLKEAKDAYGRSKVLQGRYVAEQIASDVEKIPIELKKVISIIKEGLEAKPSFDKLKQLQNNI